MAPAQLLTIPAFFPINRHTDPSKATDWVRIQSAGPWVQTVVALGDRGGFQEAPPSTACAPSGSGGELCDARNQFQANRQANQFVYGYANTQFATRSYSPGSALMSEFLDWQSNFPTQVQGMFLDNGPSFDPGQSTLSDQDFRDYYLPLYTILRGSPFNWQVMINVSQFTGKDPATGGPSDWVLSGPAADSAVVFEREKTAFDNGYHAIGPGGNVAAAPAWWQSPGTFKTAHIISQATQFDVIHVADSSRQRGASLLYTFDGDSGSYGHVSCFLEEEVTYLRTHQLANGQGKTWCPASAACFDLRSDQNHCGTCTNICSADWTCKAGVCTAPPPPPPTCKNCVTP